MNRKRVSFFLSVMILVLFLSISTPGNADSSPGLITVPADMMPDNTVILANEMDARFSQDLSVLLKNLRLEWIVLDSASVPDSVKDRNLVPLGHRDAVNTGDLVRAMVTTEETEKLRAAGDHHLVLNKENP